MQLTFHGESVIFLLMGVFSAGAGIYGRRLQRARQQRGLRTMATLIALTPSRQLFTPKVRFTTADQREVTTTCESAADAGQYEVGQHVEIIYDPQNPENADMAAIKPSNLNFMVVLGLLFVVLAVLQMLGYVPVFEKEDI